MLHDEESRLTGYDVFLGSVLGFFVGAIAMLAVAIALGWL